MNRYLVFFILFISAAFAATATTSGTWSAGTYRGATETGGSVGISLATTLSSTITATVSGTYNPGDTVTIPIAKSAAWRPSGTSFTATSSAPAGASSSSAGSSTGVAINFDSTAYSALSSRYSSNCAYRSATGISYTCVNYPSGYGCVDNSGSYSSCNYDPFSGKTTGQESTTYYRYTYDSFSGNGQFVAICSGNIYVNGNNVGSIESTNSVSVTIPAGATNPYTVPVEMRYTCFFVLHRLYSAASASTLSPLYYSATSVSVTESVSIPVTVTPAPTCSASWSPSPVTVPGSSTISWSSSNANSASISCSGPTSYSASGLGASSSQSLSFSSSGTETCTVTVSGTGGTGTCSASLSVNPAACTDTAGISVLGVLPSPVTLVGNSANIDITVLNTGNVAASLTGVTTSAGFTFTPSTSLPLSLAAGSSIVIQGTLTYTGGGNPPATATITVNGNANVCGASTALSSSSTVSISQGVDLQVVLTANDTSLTQDDWAYTNATVTNIGTTDVTSASNLDIIIMHCNNAALTDCPGSTSTNSYSVPALTVGSSSIRQSDDFQCEGYAYVGVTATLTTPVTDTNPGNNVDTIAIPCAMETCTISGPSTIDLLSGYTFSANCFLSNGTQIACDSMISGNFNWDFSVNPVGSLDFTSPTYSGVVRENSSITVSAINANGTLSIDATGTVSGFGNTITCNRDVQIVENVCANQI